MWSLLLGLAGTASSDAIAIALREELRRSQAALRLDDAPAPYFIQYDLEQIDTFTVTARLGGIVEAEAQPAVTLGVAVRVGDPALDNSNFYLDWNTNIGWERSTLGAAADPDTIRTAAWLATDAAYKNAAINLGRKQSYRRTQPRRGAPADFLSVPGAIAWEQPTPHFDTAPLIDLARSLSTPFLDHPDIESSEVLLVARAGRRLLLDTLGTDLSRAQSSLILRVSASARAPDGELRVDHATWVVNDPSTLPPAAALQAGVAALIDRLEQWRLATPLPRDYIGPVIFEGEAAIDLWSFLLVPRLGATPAVEQTFSGNRRAYAPTSPLHRRVLPLGWTVTDDPQADPSSPAAQLWDDEGIPTIPVQVILDGIVVDPLSARTPGQEQTQSNGHARGDVGELAHGTPTMLTIEAPQTVSPRRLERVAFDAAAAAGQGEILVVRRFADPTVTAGDPDLRGWLMRSLTASQPRLRRPAEVVRRFPDGHEEAVRGLAFVEAEPWVLRGVLAAGPAVEGIRLLRPPGLGGYLHETDGVPVWVQGPSVVIDDLRLAPDPGAAQSAWAVPSPLAPIR